MFKAHFSSDELEHLLALIHDLNPKTGTIEVVVDSGSGIGNVVKARVPVTHCGHDGVLEVVITDVDKW